MPDEVVDAVKSELGWPATAGDIRQAMRHVSDDMVKSVTACGSVTDALEKIEEYIATGTTVAVLTAVGDGRRTVEEIVKATVKR